MGVPPINYRAAPPEVLKQSAQDGPGTSRIGTQTSEDASALNLQAAVEQMTSRIDGLSRLLDEVRRDLAAELAEGSSAASEADPTPAAEDQEADDTDPLALKDENHDEDDGGDQDDENGEEADDQHQSRHDERGDNSAIESVSPLGNAQGGSSGGIVTIGLPAPKTRNSLRRHRPLVALGDKAHERHKRRRWVQPAASASEEKRRALRQRRLEILASLEEMVAVLNSVKLFLQSLLHAYSSSGSHQLPTAKDTSAQK